MAEQLISDRVIFPKGKQRQFLEQSRVRLGLTNSSLVKLLRIGTRSFSDWKREKSTLPLSVVKFLARKTKSGLPKRMKIKDRYWYTREGARRGGISSYRKQGGVIGDPKKREVRWREWWKTVGKFQQRIIFQPLPFKKPTPSNKFAEFIGIMMGDGGMSRRQLTITLHHIDDLPYSRFVVRLMKNLFDITPSVYHDIQDSVNNIVISRSGLVQHLHALGLPIGNKVRQQFDIPLWIKRNRQFRIACVRGLVDTDGSVFTHHYKVNGKWYSYKKLDFSSMSFPLRQSVYALFKEIGLHPRFAQNKSVRLDSVQDMKKYFKIVSSHNPKHLKRYAK